MKILALGILAIIATSICFAQNNQTESIVISTYYPSPAGVYQTIRLYPSQQPQAGTTAVQPGTMFYNQTDQTIYIYNGTSTAWEKIGFSGSGSVVKIDSGNWVVPDVCPAAASTGYANDCYAPFYIDIAFNGTFSSPPDVIVSPIEVGASAGCTHASDALRAHPSNITTTGFRLWAGARHPGGCNHSLGNWWTAVFIQAAASWMATGE